MDNAPSKTWELTLYERHRKPQEPITDGTEIAVSPRSLKSELMCPICLDILKVTMTTKECLHRFCSDCIVTALRSGNKECPTCRKKLVSKRSLRRDPNFDALIAKIYPSREEYEAHQNKILAKLNHHHLNSALTRSLEQQLGLGIGSRAQPFVNGRTSSSLVMPQDGNGDGMIVSEDEVITSARRLSRANSDTETNSVGGTSSFSNPDLPFRGAHTSAANMNSTSTHSNPMLSADSAVYAEIEVMLKPRPNVVASPSGRHHNMMSSEESASTSVNGNTSSVKYLKAPTITTIDHLSRYLAVRLNLQHINRDGSDDDGHMFSLYVYNEATNTYTQLESNLSLGEINQTYVSHSPRQSSSPICLDLYYNREDSNQQTTASTAMPTMTVSS